MKNDLEELVRKIAYNDLPHIQSRLTGLEAQGKITISLVIGLILAVVAAAVAVAKKFIDRKYESGEWA